MADMKALYLCSASAMPSATYMADMAYMNHLIGNMLRITIQSHVPLERAVLCVFVPPICTRLRQDMQAYVMHVQHTMYRKQIPGSLCCIIQHMCKETNKTEAT